MTDISNMTEEQMRKRIADIETQRKELTDEKHKYEDYLHKKKQERELADYL